MSLLNIGCGNRFHPQWTNIDYVCSDGYKVIVHDLTKGIPFPESSFDVVYHSHFLEHLTRSQAVVLMEECYRVLKPKGVIRIVVPDLEKIVRDYIHTLEKATLGDLEAAKNYDWLMLELLDQTARNYSGGEIANYLFQSDIPNKDFVLDRVGVEAENLIAKGSYQKQSSFRDNWLRQVLKCIYKFFAQSDYRKNLLLQLSLNPADYQALQIGRFRQSGENHLWMYDHYSLNHLLNERGFQKIVQRTAHDSYIENWISFNLDTESNGTVYKPDSIYMEAIKSS